MSGFTVAGITVDVPELTQRLAAIDSSLLALTNAVTALTVRVAALEVSAANGGVAGLNGVAKLWAGTTADYNAISPKAADTVYLYGSP